ncbi:ABC transporter substrate-binding protein [Clostridium sp. DL1XJH146]
MNNKYFSVEDTIFDITEKYEEAIDLLVSVGFHNFKEQKGRETFGKAISLENALKMKKINVETFVEELIQNIENNKLNRDEAQGKNNVGKEADVRIEGILPCPVKLPLLEGFDAWMAENDLGFKVDYELKSASMGVDWLKESLEKSESADVLADIFISAGFDLFFDKNLIGKYKEKNVFEDITDSEKYNKDFENDYISLKDPDKEYSMIGVVPAVFLINRDELGDRKMPTSWEDVLSPEFENRVSLPIGDFDLFNAILLNIYNKYGEDGVKRLGKSLFKSMHPSQMVKSHIGKMDKPIVTIMPYFFTKMTKNGGPMAAVWPKDGAIISPIFMLTKKDKKDKIKPIVDFFASKGVGEILSHNGRFPSVHPELDNMITAENKYMWVGWDFIKNNDIGALIKHCEDMFNESVKGVQ